MSVKHFKVEARGEGIMSRKRTSFTTEFKTQVVLEALRGDLSISQLASKYTITSKNILNWKQLFFTGMGGRKQARSQTSDRHNRFANPHNERIQPIGPNV